MTFSFSLSLFKLRTPRQFVCSFILIFIFILQNFHAWVNNPSVCIFIPTLVTFHWSPLHLHSWTLSLPHLICLSFLSLLPYLSSFAHSWPFSSSFFFFFQFIGLHISSVYCFLRIYFHSHSYFSFFISYQSSAPHLFTTSCISSDLFNLPYYH